MATQEGHLADWEGTLPADFPQDEMVIKMGDERKGLIHVLQQ